MLPRCPCDARRAGHEPQERRHDAQREHREHAGLAVEVGARHHQGAGHQPDAVAGWWWRFSMPRRARPARQHDEPGHDRERSLADQQARQRDARQDEAGQERGGNVASPSPDLGAPRRRPPPRWAPASSGRPGPRRRRRPSAARRRPRRGRPGCPPRRRPLGLVTEQVVQVDVSGLRPDHRRDLVDRLVSSTVPTESAAKCSAAASSLDVGGLRRRPRSLVRSVVGCVEEPALIRSSLGSPRRWSRRSSSSMSSSAASSSSSAASPSSSSIGSGRWCRTRPRLVVLVLAAGRLGRRLRGSGPRRRPDGRLRAFERPRVPRWGVSGSV